MLWGTQWKQIKNKKNLFKSVIRLMFRWFISRDRAKPWHVGDRLRAQDWHHPRGPLTAQRLNSQWLSQKNCKRSPAKTLKSLISDCFSYGWNLWGRQVMSYPGVALSICKLHFLIVWFDWVQVNFHWGHMSTPLVWDSSSGRCPSWWNHGIRMLVSKLLDEHFWRALLKIWVIWSVINMC